ncbi:DUF4823 domain-containing protein [Sulfurimonas sp. CS5]|uniref:DUF4823 domain-containing protein n=1 Tax=Sulfurimonas sp. CS5 TaxID=3391145 RepID=UPI0039EAFDBB
MKKISYIVMILSFAIIFSGCGGSGLSLNTIKGNELEKSQLLTKESSIYLVNGGDGMKKTYLSAVTSSEEKAIESGLSAINIANTELRTITPYVILENKVITEKEAIENAKLNKSDYVIYSRVEKWTDPLGINCHEYYRDESTVLLSLYSTKDDKLLNTTRLFASDCPATLNGIPLSTGSPESLYEDLFSMWIKNHFLVTSK